MNSSPTKLVAAAAPETKSTCVLGMIGSGLGLAEFVRMDMYTGTVAAAERAHKPCGKRTADVRMP